MNLTRTYDVSALDAGARAQLRETITLGRQTIGAVQETVDGSSMTVEARDEGTLAYVDGLVRALCDTRRRLRHRVTHRHRARARWSGDVDAELAASGEALALGDGLVAMRGRVLRLFRFFEDKFLGMAHDCDADEHRYPAMLPLAVLEEIGYFAHFPQQVTFCAHFPEDLRSFERASRSASNDRDGYRDGLAKPEHALAPAVCLPCYRQYRGRVLRDGEAFAVTMQNRVYRYEGANFRSLARLWDFTVRDIVFFGNHQNVAERRRETIERTFALCEQLDLDATIELANDPFFLDASRNKAIYQRLGEVKFELLLHLPQRPATPLAVSSFNLHRDFYTRLYDIRQSSGELAETACTGFGIERWVYAFLSQKGLDPGAWPRPVAEFVGA